MKSIISEMYSRSLETLAERCNQSEQELAVAADVSRAYYEGCVDYVCSTESTIKLADFVYALFNSEKYKRVAYVAPNSELSGFVFTDVVASRSMEFTIDDCDAVLCTCGLKMIKITDSYIRAQEFLLAIGHQLYRFYILPQLYSWILLDIGATRGHEKSMTVKTEEGPKHLAIIKSSSLAELKTSSCRAVKYFAQHYTSICSVAEQLITLPEGTVVELQGEITDLSPMCESHGTHKSPVEHVRRGFERRCASGKIVYVRPTIVMPGNKPSFS